MALLPLQTENPLFKWGLLFFAGCTFSSISFIGISSKMGLTASLFTITTPLFTSACKFVKQVTTCHKYLGSKHTRGTKFLLNRKLNSFLSPRRDCVWDVTSAPPIFAFLLLSIKNVMRWSIVWISMRTWAHLCQNTTSTMVSPTSTTMKVTVTAEATAAAIGLEVGGSVLRVHVGYELWSVFDGGYMCVWGGGRACVMSGGWGQCIVHWVFVQQLWMCDVRTHEWWVCEHIHVCVADT